MRDPCIIRGPDGLFHMVWTVSWNDRGIGYASSKDLVNWSEQVFIPVMSHEPRTLNCRAPEIAYDPKAKQFMIYWSTTIPGRFPKSEALGDEKYNHRLYYTTTRDFKTFSATSRKLKKDYSSPGPAITGNYWAEGPTAIRFNHKWWLYFDKYTLHQYGALQSEDLQQWTDISSQVKFPDGARHGSVLIINRAEFNHLLQN